MASDILSPHSEVAVEPPSPTRRRRGSRAVSALLAVLLVVVLAIAPLFLNAYRSGLIATILMYSLGVLGFQVLVGWSGQIGLAHAGFFGLGAYGSVLLVNAGVPFLLAVPIVVIGSVLLGALVALPAVQLRGFFLAIATLAFGELIVAAIREARDITGGGGGIDVPEFLLFGQDETRSAYYLALIAAVLGFILLTRLLRGRFGRTLKAIRDMEVATGPIGIPAARYKLLAFALSACVGAVAGVVYAQLVGFIFPDQFGSNLLVILLVMLLVGGVGSVPGTVIGVIFGVLIVELFQDFGEYQLLAYGLTLIVIVRFLPGGIASIPARLRTARNPGLSLVEVGAGLALISVGLGLLDPPVAVVPVRVVAGVLLVAGLVVMLVMRRREPAEAVGMTATSVAQDAAVREGPPPLELRDLGVAFGGNVVLQGVTLTFGPGFNGLIGPNGAGKTTCFNVVSGYVRPTGGEVALFGEPVQGQSQAEIAARGVGRTFQAPRLVQDESVLENVLLGMHHRYRHGHVAELFGLPTARRAEREARARAVDLLDAFGLGGSADLLANSIPLPGQKLVEVVRALVSQPRLLLLDEPAAGLGATDVDVLLDGLRTLVREGELCVVIIEHDLELVVNLCSSVAVLNEGKIIADGPPQQVVKDPAVITAYLGASVAEG